MPGFRVVLLCGTATIQTIHLDGQTKEGDYSVHECDATRPQYNKPSINGDLNYRYIRPLFFPRSLVMLAGTTNPLQKTTVMRFVHILAVVHTSHWGPPTGLMN